MKTLKQFLILMTLLFGSFYSNAQFLCGVNAAFTQNVNPNNVASFYDTSRVDANWQINSWAWDFGDGTMSSLQNPTHVYSFPATYTVCLTVTAGGMGFTCSDSVCYTMAVGSPGCGNTQANFTATSNGSGVVVLQSTSTGTPSGALYQWWMDGNAITNPNPNTAYTMSNVGNGYHNFCLYVYVNNISSFCDSTCQTIFVGNCNVTAAYQYMVHTSWVSFYPVANTPTPVYHRWNFGDGTDSVYATNITWLTHSFPVNPNTVTYQVCHYVYLGGTNCVDSICQYVVVAGTTTSCGTASFTQTVSGGVIHAISNSTGVDSTTQYQWYIWGPNNVLVQTQTGHDITSQSLAAGTYQICLYLYSANQTFCDSACQTVIITNSNPCGGLTAHWGFAVLSNDSVRFETLDTNLLANHYWNFGDGSTGSGFGVTHQYANNGTYRVCSYVYIPGTACVDSFCQYITVNNTPCAGLTAQWTQNYVANNGVQFIPGNQANNATYYWSFGDGQTSTQHDPTHYYSAAGLYNVCLLVSIPGSICRDSSCHSIQANAGNACSGVTATITRTVNPNGGYYLGVSYSGTIVSTYSWSTGATTSAIPAVQPGVYCVTVVDINGCSASDCDSVGSNTNPCQAEFTYYHTSTCGRVEFLNTSTGNFNHSTWYFGDGTSSNVTNPVHVFPAGTWTVQLTVYNTTGNCQSSYYAVITVQPCSGNDTICGIVFEDANGNGILDLGEYGISGAHVYAGNYSAFADSFGHYSIVVPSGTYSITYCAPTGYTYTLPINQNNNGLNCNGYYNVTVIGNGTHCGFDFGIQLNSVSICGVVYLDANNNHTQDNGENGIANVHIEIVSSTGHVYHAYTDQSGHYCVLVPVGNYTIHAASSNFNTCPITPQSISVTATSAGQVLNGNNFGAYCQPGLCDLMVNITPHTTVTAGFPAWYDIQVCNIGSSVSSGTLSMYYDAALTFDHASPVQTSHNASVRTITWDIVNLLPGNCRYIWVYLDADSNVVVGQHVFTLVNITPDVNCNDVNMVNNVDTVHQDATSSWDPNNKLAYTTNHENDPAYQWVSSIDANQRLEYVINFQNTGNSPAVNVVVKDIISSDLDISSYEFLGASHPCVVTSNNGELNYKFSDIMLAAESTDEPNSHGWIKFAINSVNGLPGGHIISDPADIYFDYNQPVATNDAAVIMLAANGIDEIESNVTVVIAPNPMSQYAEVRLNNSKADKFQFRVTDLTGRLVAEKTSSGNSLLFERDALAAGLYTYQIIQSNTIVAKGKLVIE